MNNNIHGLLKQYILWPELNNDFQRNIAFGDVNMNEFYRSIRNLSTSRENIQTEIASFYWANEQLSKSRLNSQDVLGVEELKSYGAYKTIVEDLSKKLISYITVCCIVEARHIQDDIDYIAEAWCNHFDSGEAPESADVYGLYDMNDVVETLKGHRKGKAFLKEYFNLYRSYVKTDLELLKMIDFQADISSTVSTIINHMSGGDDRDAAYTEVVDEFLSKNLDDYTLENTLNYLYTMFSEGSWEEGYGGSAWADIAKHGLDFVQGKINAEMFVDQAFSLEHNNGNMFNKDYLFHETSSFTLNYTCDLSDDTDGIDITTTKLLLNAQHLGMIQGLLNCDKMLEQLNALDSTILFEQIKKEKGIHEFEKQMEQEYALEEFTEHLNLIKDNYSNIIEEFDIIKNSIKSNYPDLLVETGNTFVDFKRLINEIASHEDGDSDYYDLENATSNDEDNFNFFSLWNHIHNNILAHKNNFVQDKPFSVSLYDVANLPEPAFNKDVIGGKAWGLANMNNLGLPVPKAQVFGTDCCATYHNYKGNFIIALQDHITKFQDYLVDDNKNPVLCSVRSGAPISMPGMMDTVLNVGIDDSNYDYFCEKMGKKVVDDCVSKFMELFCSSRLGITKKFDSNLTTNLLLFRNTLEQHSIEVNEISNFPLNRYDQIEQSLYAVFDSWYSERAIAYRNEKNIDHNMGTAAIVQQMVFGNLNDNSCTGVVFSRDCLTGENKLVGEFLPKAQGEDVVSGSVTPFPISEFERFNKKAYDQLVSIAKKLEKQTGQIQDIEFTVEDGKLYILQHRQAVCSPIAAVKILQDKSLNQDSILKNIEPKNLRKSYTVVTEDKEAFTGLSANSGVISGIVINAESEMKFYENKFKAELLTNPNFGWIFYSKLTSPEHMPIMNKTHGFITSQGGFTSHAAIIARSLNKPCIVGIGHNDPFISGEIITMDGDSGKIWKGNKQVIENKQLARSVAKLVIHKNQVDLKEIDTQEFKDYLENINEKNRSWVFNFDCAKYVNKKPIKKDKFLDLGQRVAMVLIANDRYEKKLNIKM